MGIKNLFSDTFDIQIKETNIKDLLNKKTEKQDISPEKLLKSKKLSLDERLVVIKENVLKVLGHYKSNILVIKDKETFINYISSAIASGRIAIDTETNNSLDPITCKLMGLCLYYPGGKQAYIPINHINNETGERLSWQLTEQDCQEQLKRVIDSKIVKIFHNNKFDYEVIKCTCNIEVTADWDTLIGAYLIDENDFSHGLKQLYIKYIDHTQEKYSIDHLFNNVLYEQVDPEVFAYYAATDAWMTDALYIYQKEIFESEEYVDVYRLFKDVELPCIQVVAEMELQGILFDNDYADRLRTKFETQLQSIDLELNKELKNLSTDILAWRNSEEANAKSKVYVPAKTSLTESKIIESYPYIEEETKKRYKLGKPKNEQLNDPIDLNSPTQLAILFYDILKYKQVDKDNPRGTGEEVLEKLNTPICKLLLKRRGVVKMLDAFINSLPKKVNPKTKKIHCNFNQYGAKTGRFSCSEPNLQQIPSHMKSMRLLFSADPGYVLCGSDFSQQEPRLLSYYSQDKNMIGAYKDGKDLYATIAMGVYNLPYWDCMEHHEDGSPNPEGKKRRASCKSILLGRPSMVIGLAA